MKTKLPEAIKTIAEAKAFLDDLMNNKEAYHPEDDAHDIIFHLPSQYIPTINERDKLNKLMQDIYAFKGNENCTSMVFDPCDYMNAYFHRTDNEN